MSFRCKGKDGIIRIVEWSNVKNAWIPVVSISCDQSEKLSHPVKKECDLSLSNSEIEELQDTKTEVGTLSTNKNENGVFTLYSDFIGQNDNDKFVIEGNKLKSNQIFYHRTGVSYKVGVNYSGAEYHTRKEFDILITSSKDNLSLGLGTQILVSSSDNNVELTFENITKAGEVKFEKVSSESSEISIYNINTDAEFSENITISFNDFNINPENNPAIIHLKYDEELEEVAYEDITTEVIEGKISGVVNSLSPFMIGSYPPPNAWGPGQGQCDFRLTVTPPEPCPGNQTRGNWAITEDGIGPPRLLGGTCGCWEPSQITIDLILGAASGVSAAKAGICAIMKNIFDLKSIIKALITIVDDAMTAIRALVSRIGQLRSQMAALMDDINNLVSQVNAAIARKNSLDDEINKLREIINELSKSGVTIDVEKDPLWHKLNTLIDEDNRVRKIILERMEKAKDLQRQYDTKASDLITKELDLSNQQSIRQSAEADLFVKQSILEMNEKTLSTRLQELAASILLLYSYLNEISVQKTCPEGQTLNPLTCECCPNCTGGKVFPNPMDGCNCECPEGKVPCFSLVEENCYDPCPEGQIRAGSNCECISLTTTTTPAPCVDSCDGDLVCCDVGEEVKRCVSEDSCRKTLWCNAYHELGNECDFSGNGKIPGPRPGYTNPGEYVWVNTNISCSEQSCENCEHYWNGATVMGCGGCTGYQLFYVPCGSTSIFMDSLPEWNCAAREVPNFDYCDVAVTCCPAN